MKHFSTIALMTLCITHGSANFTEKPHAESTGPNDSSIVFDTVVGSNTVRMLQIKANMVVDTADDLLEKVDRAKAKGANTVLFADTKLNAFGIGNDPGAKWQEETRKLFEGIQARDMDLVLATSAMGFCGSLIADAPNLTTGYPIKNQRLRAVNGILVPESTAAIENGGFDDFTDDRPSGWGFQDAPGELTFIDQSVKRSGNASLRAEATNGKMSRIFTDFSVEPFHQYTLSFWIKTENLEANKLLALVRDENDRERSLTNLYPSIAKDNGGREYINPLRGLTLDWTEVRIAFNSQNATEVNIVLALYGGSAGRVWWDDVKISDTPTLNWLNRDDLPKSIKLQNGGSLQFGTDVEIPLDERLGISGFPGKYDTQHQAPQVAVLNASAVPEGTIVELSGYHALPTSRGQVSCSWNNEEVLDRLRRVHQKLQDTYNPDGFLVNYSEVRTGGWEPSDTEPYPTSGAAFAAAIEKAFNDLFEIAPDAKHYFWSDMVDPEHNAVDKYYQVNNTMADSWKTLDPDKVILATWWEGEKITNNGPVSLQFFAEKGFDQVLGGFYDADVTQNFERWQTAAQGVDGIVGNMYATWTKDYEKIEAFGDLWWSDTDTARFEDAIIEIVAPRQMEAGTTQNVSILYSAERDRELMVSFQRNVSPWKPYGWYKTTVAEGENTIEVPMEISAEAPSLMSGYTLVVYTAPLGGSYDNYIALDRVTSIDILPTDEQSVLDPNQNLLVYPNPADSYVEIQVPNDAEKIDVYDLNGTLLKSLDTEEKSQIDVSQMNPGVYLISVEEGDGDTHVRKLIVEH